MTKLSQTVIACISAMIMLAGVASSARANSFFYFLDNNTLADANGGPSLVSYGGTLSNGYTFGVQQGLSLSGTGIFDNGTRELRTGSRSVPQYGTRIRDLGPVI